MKPSFRTVGAAASQYGCTAAEVPILWQPPDTQTATEAAARFASYCAREKANSAHRKNKRYPPAERLGESIAATDPVALVQRKQAGLRADNIGQGDDGHSRRSGVKVADFRRDSDMPSAAKISAVDRSNSRCQPVKQSLVRRKIADY